jgi:hypothetical protein
LTSPTAIVPPPSPSPIATPADAHHRHRRHCRPSIAPCRSSHAATHLPLSNHITCQGACGLAAAGREGGGHCSGGRAGSRRQIMWKT